jgi:hypothetical protein
MSEHNYAGLLFKTNLEQHPEVFIINDATIAEVEQKAKEMRAERDVVNPPKPANPYEEFRQLRGTLRQLEQNVNNTAIYATSIAGNVALIEKNIQNAAFNQQHAFKSGNERAEINCKNAVTRLKDDELAEAQKELKRAKTQMERAAKALAAFDQHGRIAELQAHFESLTNI